MHRQVEVVTTPGLSLLLRRVAGRAQSYVCRFGEHDQTSSMSCSTFSSDVAAWLRSRGVAQWPARFPTDWVTPTIEAGETWLAEIGGEIVGSLVVQWDDPLFWAADA